MQGLKNSVNKKQIIFIVIFAIIECVSLFFLWRYLVTVRHAERKMLYIQENYIKIPDHAVSDQDSTPLSNETADAPSFSIPKLEIDFEALQKEVNADIYSWILIPDTPINYPIVQHPDDNAYYINHNLDGSEGYPGCIYTENYNFKDWEDTNTILYGHNMRNGSMFSKINSFAKKDFFEEHPYIYLYSADAIRVYQVFAAYEFSDLHLMTVCDWDDPEAVSQFFSAASAYPGNFDKTVELQDDGHYLTLSTCRNFKKDKRFLVHAMLVFQE